jgi:hypothetical protein
MKENTVHHEMKILRTLSLFLVAIVVAVLLSSCSQVSKQNVKPALKGATSLLSSALENNNTYTFATETYQYKDINILYPQITEMEDTTKEEKLNALIKDFALRGQFEYLTKVPVETLFNDGIEDISYKVVLNTQNIISILFSEKGAGKYPGLDPKYYHDARCLTIDVSTLKVMNLADFVPDDGTFQEMLLKSTDVFICTGEKVNKHDEYYSLVQDNIQDLKSYETAFSSKMSENVHRFYVTPTSLGAVVWVGHALGDYVLVEVPR